MSFKPRVRPFVFSALAAALLLVTALPSPAEAQRRYRRQVVVVGGYPYPYWGYRSWNQWGPWGPYGYPPYGYGYGYIADVSSALRLDVAPREAQVFVDGYYAGLVDEFDGVFQRLRVQPGGHVITLYLDGYRTVAQELYLRPGSDQRVKLALEPLAAGERSEPPTPPQEDRPEPADRGPQYRGDPRNGVEVEPQRQAPPPAVARFGTLSLRVQPADAEILVDGERWNGVLDQERVVIQLSEGRHRVEIRKSGLSTYTEEVLIRRDRTMTLNVSLVN